MSKTSVHVRLRARGRALRALALIVSASLLSTAVMESTVSAASGGHSSATAKPVAAAPVLPRVEAVSSSGALKTVRASVAWGGSKGKKVTKGKQVVARVTGASVPRTARSLLIQVRVDGAKKAGTLEIREAGTNRSKTPIVAFVKGNSSSTVLVKRSAANQVALISSVNARVQLSVLGYAAGTAKVPGPGGTQAIAGFTLVDSAAKIGAPVLAKGKTGSVSVLGLSAVPTDGVRAVWLQVQTQGKGAGSLSVRRADGGNSSAASVAVAKGWSTGLVLAPVSSVGSISYTVRGRSLSALRISVVGWVAESSATAASATAAGGIVTVAARGAKAKKVAGTRHAVRRSVTLTGQGVPTRATRVLVRVTAVTGESSGYVRVGTTAGNSVKKSAAGVPVAAKSRNQVTLVAPVNASGRAFLSAPKGTKLSQVTVLGYVAVAVSKLKDKKAPSVVVTSPVNGATIDLAKTPVATITGTARDDQSGIGRVHVYSGATFIGAAIVDTTTVPARWTLQTSMPGGSHTISVTAADRSGRQASAARKYVGKIPATDVAVVAPDVEVITPTASKTLTRVTSASLVFNGPAPANLQVGDVTVGGVSTVAPKGYMRRIAAIRTVGTTTTVDTVDATYTDVFYQLKLDVSSHEPQQGTASAKGLSLFDKAGSLVSQSADDGAGLAIKYAFNLRFPIGSDGGHADIGHDPYASLRYEADTKVSLDTKVDIDVEWDWFVPHPAIHLFEVAVVQKGTAETTIKVQGDFNFVKKQLKLARITGPTITLAVGPVPLVFTSGMTPRLEASVAAIASTSVVYTQNIDTRTGFSLRGTSFSRIDEKRGSSGWDSSKLTAELSATAMAELEFDVSFYDFVGPTISLGIEFRYGFIFDVNCSIEGSSGVIRNEFFVDIDFVAYVGVRVRAFSVDLADFEFEVARADLFDTSFPITTIDPDAWCGAQDPGNPGNPGDPGDPGDPGVPPVLSSASVFGRFSGTGGDVWFTRPTSLLSDVDLVKVDAGLFSGYALSSDGKVWAWGQGSNGQLGLGLSVLYQGVPTVIPGLENIVDIWAGATSAYALDSSGDIWAWGGVTRDLQNADTGTSNRNVYEPIRVAGLRGVKQIVADDDSAYALMSDGKLKLWGVIVGASGVGSGGGLRDIANLRDIKELAIGSNAVYALDHSGTIFAWGGNRQGELGNGGSDNVGGYAHSLVPTTVVGITDAVSIGAGEDTGFAIRSDGTVWSWGGDTDGIRGTTPSDSRFPEKVDSVTNAVSVVAGYGHALALTADGTVWSWGSDWEGALGRGLDAGDIRPGTVPGLTGITDIAAGDSTSYVFRRSTAP